MPTLFPPGLLRAARLVTRAECIPVVVPVWDSRQVNGAQHWGTEQSAGEQGLGGTQTVQEACLCPGRVWGPALFIVCHAWDTEREVREPHYACTHHLPASTQPPMKWLLALKPSMENGLLPS